MPLSFSGGSDAVASEEACPPAHVQQPQVRQEGRDAQAHVSATDVRAFGRAPERTDVVADTPPGVGPFSQPDSLPPEEELKFSVRRGGSGRACGCTCMTVGLHHSLSTQLTAEGQGWGGGARAQPPSASSLLFDELPRGPDDCLSGETFVFTGNLPRLSRCDPYTAA